MKAIERFRKFNSTPIAFIIECESMASEMDNGKHPAGCDSDGERIRILIEMAHEWFEKNKGAL